MEYFKESQSIASKVFQISLLNFYVWSVWNDEALKDLKFPRELNLEDVVPAFKKEYSTLV